MNTADMADEIARLRKERDELSELLEAAGIYAKEIKAENEQLHAELAQMRASLHEAMLITKDWYANDDDTGTCLGRLDAWSMRAMANPAAALEARDARMKAEALEGQAAEMIAMNDERNTCSVHDAARHLQRLAAEYRKQAEGEA